jgi:ABC-type phosphate transport system auxiliary subunit
MCDESNSGGSTRDSDQQEEEKIIAELDALAGRVAALEDRLREVRNRMSRGKHVAMVDWSGVVPRIVGGADYKYCGK